MFWPFLAASAVSVGLIRLGALSVWVSVLKAILSVVVAAVLAASFVFAWRRYKQHGFNGGE
jgi:hypothetical protein